MDDGSTGANGHTQLAPGEMFGDYTVEKLLGKGGMGAVYLVRAPDGERYAVKVLDADIARDMPDMLKRFLREAEFAIAIRHPNLIPVHRVGQDPKTRLCYLVMDYMPGGSLADRLGKRKRLSVEEALSIVVQIAEALEVAHRHGVIHRDIKPGNILFDLDGTPKLADMGVAKFTDGAHKTTVTTTGMIIGTPAYMAPEQMMDSRHIDARADIYALGVVLYEMLTGCRPHEESTAVELLAKAIKGEPLPDVRTLRPEVSAALAYVLSLMCAPKPEERPPTPHAVVEMVQQAENGTLEVPQEILTPPVAKREWRKRFRVAVPVAAALFVAGAVGWGASKWLGASKLRQGLVQFTNTVNQVTVVTNQVIQSEDVKGDDAADPARNDEHSSSVDGGNVQRDISGATTAKRSNPIDFSKLDPIRYAEMDDRTMVKELLSIDGDGTVGKDVARHGGIDGFCRRNGPLSVSRRKALVNMFIIRDALVLIGLPRELVAEAVAKARDTPKVVNMSIGKLLQTFPALQLFLADPVVRRQATSDISQKVIDFLQAAFLPFRVCVMDFTTTDVSGQIRFIDPANNKLDVAPRCTLNDANSKIVNDVMLGFVRLVDAVENRKTKDIKNAITRNDAIDLWRTSVHGQSRSVVVGAEYLEAYLGGHGDVFECLDRPLMAAAMQNLQNDPDFPSDFQLKLAKASGATHLIYGTVGDITSCENSFSGFDIQVKTTNFSIKVTVKMRDLVTQQTVHCGVYTGTCRGQRPISGSKFDNNIFQSLMKSALQQAAEDIYDMCRPGRKNKIRVTPLPAESKATDHGYGGGDGGAGSGGSGQDKIGIAKPTKLAPPSRRMTSDVLIRKDDVLIWDGTSWSRRSNK